MTSEQDRSAALVVRVWLEGGNRQFRARLTAVEASGSDITDEEVSVAVVASPADAVEALRSWLVRFVDRDA